MRASPILETVRGPIDTVVIDVKAVTSVPALLFTVGPDAKTGRTKTGKAEVKKRKIMQSAILLLCIDLHPHQSRIAHG